MQEFNCLPPRKKQVLPAIILLSSLPEELLLGCVSQCNANSSCSKVLGTQVSTLRTGVENLYTTYCSESRSFKVIKGERDLIRFLFA